MTKLDLISELAEKLNLPKTDIEKAVNVVFDSIVEALSKGEKVELRGFGVFKVRTRNGRIARNPKTGEEVRVEGKIVPYFRPGKELEEAVRNYRK
ncbi:MAG: HU family DNA-binding protein [Thermosulfidibacteraceae bacterium]|jgi:integration host factor beta subunit